MFNVCIVVVCFPVCYVIDFEIYLSIKKSVQKLKYFKTEKSESRNKTFFVIFRGFPCKHTTCISRWNELETVVSTSLQRGIHVVSLQGFSSQKLPQDRECDFKLYDESALAFFFFLINLHLKVHSCKLENFPSCYNLYKNIALKISHS